MTMLYDSTKLLADVQDSIRQAPRTADRSIKKYLAAPVIKNWDASIYVEYWDYLWEQGRIAAAAIVMANQQLYQYHSDGNPTAPGVVVYSPDLNASITAEELICVARDLYEIYRNEEVEHPDQEEVAKLLKADRIPMRACVVPRSISPDHRLLISSLLFKREHFPHLTLEGNILPILHHQRTNGIVRMVPSRFWPKVLMDEWAQKSTSKQREVDKPSMVKSASNIWTGLIYLKFSLICLTAFTLAVMPTWHYLRSSLPLPQYTIADLASIPDDTLVRFSGELDLVNTYHTERYDYIPIAGSNGELWIEHKLSRVQSMRKPPSSKIENQVMTKESLNWLQYRLKDHLAKQSISNQTRPAALLVVQSDPTTGAKITRFVFLLLLFAVSLFTGIKALRAFGMMKHSHR